MRRIRGIGRTVSRKPTLKDACCMSETIPDRLLDLLAERLRNPWMLESLTRRQRSYNLQTLPACSKGLSALMTAVGRKMMARECCRLSSMACVASA